MKIKLLLSSLIVAAFFVGSFVSQTSAVDDEFSSTILAHGVEFVHTDTFAQAPRPGEFAPLTDFLPGTISLYGPNAGFNVSGFPVIVAPSNPLEIPEANGTNNTEVLNDIRAVLIDRGLAVAPE